MRRLGDYPEGHHNLFFDWGVGDSYGWGMVGYNFCKYAGERGVWRPLPMSWPMRFLSPLDPIERAVFDDYAKLVDDRTICCTKTDVMLRGQGMIVQPLLPNIEGPQIGMPYIERAALTPEEVATLNGFQGMIAGSAWQHDVLLEHGITRVSQVYQGVDLERFRPLHKRLYRDRFVVFSGGQLALRKGQDLVVAALRVFLARHPDAFLIAAWRSHWEEILVKELATSTVVKPIEYGPDMMAQIRKWLADNGLPEKQVLVLDLVSNRYLPEVLRECDVAVFPNRCEAGTNLLAMEALAAGVRSICAHNSGQRELGFSRGYIPLTEQVECGVPGWRTSNVDEIVACLELQYADEAAREILNPSWVGGPVQTWERSIYDHLQAVEELLRA